MFRLRIVLLAVTSRNTELKLVRSCKHCSFGGCPPGVPHVSFFLCLFIDIVSSFQLTHGGHPARPDDVPVWASRWGPVKTPFVSHLRKEQNPACEKGRFTLCEVDGMWFLVLFLWFLFSCLACFRWSGGQVAWRSLGLESGDPEGFRKWFIGH